MRKTVHTCFSIFSLLIFLNVLFVSVVAFADTVPIPHQNLLPDSLIPRLSVDGNTLVNGMPLKTVINDPNPAAPLRKISAPEGLMAMPEAGTASFSITYIAAGGVDAFGEACFAFPAEAKTAFDAAAHIWVNSLDSNVPITIEACWATLDSDNTLGYSGGGPLHREFTGVPRANTWYSGSLANALANDDLAPGRFDMHVTYNSKFNWYFGIDGNTPADQHDFLTVVLHEIAHGLNFSGSMDYSSGTGNWGYGTGYPNIYDVFIRDGSGRQLIDTNIYSNGSAALGTALTSDNLWFHGNQAVAANGGQRVRIYAPANWSSGSSYSHLDYNAFNNTPNQLMVWAISVGESIHDPGVVTKGLLLDLGWTVGSSSSMPTVTTQAVSSIGITDAIGNAIITTLGSSNPTQYGVCWNTSGTPGTSDSCTSQGARATTGAFTSSIIGLAQSTTYYVRAYATNTAGTAYGNQVFFTTNATAVEVIEIQSGVAVSNLAAITGNELHYFLIVPSGEISSLKFEIFGGAGDADLYVRYGSQPTEDTWDYRSWLKGNSETVIISNPLAGNWYVMVRAYVSFSGVGLQGTYSSDGISSAFPWSIFVQAITAKKQ